VHESSFFSLANIAYEGIPVSTPRGIYPDALRPRNRRRSFPLRDEALKIVSQEPKRLMKIEDAGEMERRFDFVPRGPPWG